MKKIILLAAFVAFVACTSNNAGYTIKGTVDCADSLKNGKVYLTNYDKENLDRDTVDMVDGKFTFKGVVENPDIYGISFEKMKGRVPVFLENASFTVVAKDGEWEYVEVKGGESQSIRNEYMAWQKSLEEKYELAKIEAEYRLDSTTQARREEIIAVFDKYNEKIENFNDSLVKAHPTSYYALKRLSDKVHDMKIEDVEDQLKVFKNDVSKSSHRTVAKIEETVKTLKGLQIGEVAPEFSMKNPDGEEITLSSIYKNNKVTMIDFWAGWCGPCRNFNPKLVEIYKKYHGKGFEILGVSMDRDRDTWLKAINDDKLTWPQVSDVNFWDCKPVKLYAVRYIPQNAFVDAEGKILGRKLSEEQIVSLLEEHLK